MLRAFCHDSGKDWDLAVPFVMFAVQEVPSELLGFSPNELVFGHRILGLLVVVREGWSDSGGNKAELLLDFVIRISSRLHKTLELARDNLTVAQTKMKAYYDRKAKIRIFESGKEMLALLPLQRKPLAAKFSGPYVVKKVGDLDYLIAILDRCKGVQLCHINMLKLYYNSAEPNFGSGAVTIAGGEERESDGVVVTASVVNGGGEQENSRVVLKESAEHGGEVKFGEEKVPLVLALGLDAALWPVEAQPEEPVFGDAISVGIWEEKSHFALRERLHDLTQERNVEALVWRLEKGRPGC